MLRFMYFSFFLIFLLFLNSCGEDRGSLKLSLASPNIVNIYENQTNVTTLFARSKDTLLYNIKNYDSEYFNINKTSGVITFKIAPKYKDKKLYTFNAEVIDSYGNKDSKDVIVNILSMDKDITTLNNNKNRVYYVSEIVEEGGTINQATDSGRNDNPWEVTDDKKTTTPAPKPTPTPAPTPTPDPTPINPLDEDNNQNTNNNNINDNINVEEEDIVIEDDKNNTRDNSNNIVIDDTTKLMWQDNNSVKTIKMDWETASTYCSSVLLGGYSDWRLPTLMELNGLIDTKRSNTSLSVAFKNIIASNYWSSTAYVLNSNNSWNINLYHGNTYWSHKNSKYYVTCTRNSE